jgi:hypothetical protein
MADVILKRMKCPNDFTARVCKLVQGHMHVHDIPRMKNVAKLRRLIGRTDFDQLLLLGKCDTKATENEENRTSNWEAREDQIVADFRARFNPMLPPPVITGDTLIAANLKPSPVFKRALEAAYDEQLRSDGKTEKQLLDFAMGVAATLLKEKNK